jgi:Family of unknown function (DUF6221)
VTGVEDLVLWLRAQLDDDERVAREASRYDDEDAAEWKITYGWSRVARHKVHRTGMRQTLPPGAPSPARVLAEVDAKRRIIDEAIRLESYDGEFEFLELLALPYADRPGYREEWRPVTRRI